MELFYQRPSPEEIIHAMNYYQPTNHLAHRYRQRMSKRTSRRTAEAMLNATNEELGYRANYMLLFSIHGRPGETPNTEVRYYFNWEIVVDNVKKTIITMYEDKRMLPAHLFGDAKERSVIYNLWFKNKEAVR